MSGRKPLAYPSDLAFRYDGGLKGFYCCVHESVYSRQLPMAILPADDEVGLLLPERWIETDAHKAQRVRDAVRQKISPDVQDIVEKVFLSCLPQKELPMLRFLLLAFERGRTVLNMRQDADVALLLGAARHLEGEAHLLTGFVRFSDYQGNLIATIRPKNFVLPYIAEHFVERFSCENFLIYDRTHKAALVYQNGQTQIVQMRDAPDFTPSEEELYYRDLWKQFYDTIGIKSRFNPRCRMSHMPKRYWSEMTEMAELLEGERRPRQAQITS